MEYDTLLALVKFKFMTKEEALKQSQILGKFLLIIYEEYYLPNCKEEAVKITSFFMSKEFMETMNKISKDEKKDIRRRAENYC